MEVEGVACDPVRTVVQVERLEAFDFGPEYIIPKPFDPRVLLYVAPAVAKAAMDTGVARNPIDLREYESRLSQMLGEIASL